MRLLVFGHSGQVATELRRQAAARAIALTALPRAEADLADPQACAARIAEADADVILNAAAYTAVDRAEDEEPLATTVNGAAPGAMARAAAARALPFLHVSTDYVFDGTRPTPWPEDAPTAPLGAYGRSKLAGEQAVAAAGGPHVILRTAWVFSAHGSNFVKTMLRLSETRDTVSVVDDQYGGPTPAAAIASALLTIAEAFCSGRGQSGVFHLCGTPRTTWAEFARETLSRAGRDTTVQSIPTTDYPTPAARPMNSALDCHKIHQIYGVPQPDWRAGLDAVLHELETRT